MSTRAQWWLRSLADQDTHRGTWLPQDEKVRSACGLTFTPIPTGLPPRRAPLPGYPPDPTQVCPQCATLS